MDFGLSNQSVILDTNIIFNMQFWFTMIAVVAIAVAFFILVKKMFKHFAVQRHLDQVVFLVKLPKESPDDERNGKDLQKLREEISKGETIFHSIGGLSAQRDFKAKLLGRSDHFAFEIVANNKKIAFYVVSPKNMARYIEQQIHAHYPEAAIEIVDDYNPFSSSSKTLAGYMKTRREFLYPIKTYEQMEADPMNSILNIMSKLDHDESMVIQYVVRSAFGSWHKKVSGVVREVGKGKSLNQALNSNILSKIWHEVVEIAKTAKPNVNPNDSFNNQNKLTAMQEDVMKAIEEKNSKPGLDVNVRILVSAGDPIKAKAYLENVASAFTQYNYYEYGNGFGSKAKKKNQKAIIRNYIYRRFNEDSSFLLNTEELASLFHFPLRGAETPNILWLTAKNAPAPSDMPDEGLILGNNIYRGVSREVRIKAEDRLRHIYIIGKSGVGKSVLLSNMAVQDVMNGEGCCVLDPHGDLIQDILDRVPPERAEDVIIFSPHDIERPMALNLLEYDMRYPEQKTFVINEMIGIFDKLYDLKATGGPIFEQYMRNALLLIMSDPDSGSTLMEVPKVLSDADFRNMKLDRCKDPTVVDFWRKEAEKAGGDAALANVVPYITSKLTQFISNDMMRPIIGQQHSSIKPREIMDNQKILLVDLPKGLVGELNAYLLGMILVGKILISALSRADVPQDKRKPFYLYIDEFQNFTTDSICQILSEARKYGLSLNIAHQYVGQLVSNGDTKIKDAVFGNVGTMLSFKMGSEDAEQMVKEYGPVFNEFDLINAGKGTAYAKLLIDNEASRPFSMKTTWPKVGTVRNGMAQKIRTLSRLKYGRDRHMVEAEIIERAKGLNDLDLDFDDD